MPNTIYKPNTRKGTQTKMTVDPEYALNHSLAWNALNEKDDKVKALKKEIEEHQELLKRVITVADSDVLKSRINSKASEIQHLDLLAKNAITGGSIAPLVGELRGDEDTGATPLTSKPSGSRTPRGLPVGEISAVDWPLPNNAPPITGILEKRPKWANAACIKVGRPGKGSHLWNPALFAICLVGTTTHKRWKCNMTALDRLIRTNFPDYLDEWEKHKQSL